MIDEVKAWRAAMDVWKDQHIERYFMALFLAYCLTGFYGTIWVSDEFDQERSIFYSFMVVPGLILFLIKYTVQKHWPKDYPVSFWSAILVLMLAFSWGNFLLVNALSSRDRAVVNITLNEGVYAMTHLRGGLGWLYKPRW